MKLFLAGAPLIAMAVAAGLLLLNSSDWSEKADVIAAAAGGPPVMRRLTQAQYQNVIADVFGDDIKIGGRFEPDIREGGLIEVGAGKVSVPASGLEQYAKMARSISAQALDKQHRDSMLDCRPASPAAPDDACAGRFLSQVGRLLYRRPLSQDELAPLVRPSATSIPGWRSR
jgi:hypothetical protein